MKRTILALSILVALTASAETKRLDAPRDLSKEKVIGATQYGIRPVAVVADAKTTPSMRPTVTVTTVQLVPAKPKPGLKFSDLLPVPYQRGVYYDTRPTAPPTITITTVVKK